MAEHESSIEIAADPDAVFDYLVTEDGMTAWMGRSARLDPREGGGFAVEIAGYAVRGEYLVVDRPRRVVVSWGFAGSQELPPGASTVSFELTRVSGGTRVDLRHAGLPDDGVEGHADGWAHFLPRLRLAAAGGAAGEDRWAPLGDPRREADSTPARTATKGAGP